LHFHAVVLDGVFAPNSQGRQAFYETGAPSHDELEDVVKRIRGRALRWLRKRGLFDDRRAEERSNEAPERSALDACAEVALRGGELGRLEDGFVVPPEDGSEARFEPRCRGPLTAELDGFNMEAAVRIEACDDEGRERLVRYCARPCFALERLSILRDGRVTYQVKYPRRKGTHRVMTPVVFLARLAALVPPPRYPLVRYHGVLAPHAKRRSVVVPKVPGKACKGEHRARADSPGSDDKKPAITSAPERQVPKAQPPGTQEETRNSPLTMASSPAECAASRRGAQEPALEAIWTESDVAAGRERGQSAASAALPQAGLPRTAVGFVPGGISVRHLDRVLDGLLLATSPRIEWAKLLGRMYAIDVLACPRCNGRMRLMAAITDKVTARKILSRLGLLAEPVKCRPRDPADAA
jgi:hypothetical protein